MVKFFLNSLKYLKKPKIFVFLISINFISFNLFTEPVKDILSMQSCESILTEFYKTGAIDLTPIFNSLELCGKNLNEALISENRNSEKENELLMHYLEYSKLISIAYTFGAANRYASFIKKNEIQINAFIQKVKPEAAVYIKLADYYYTKIALPSNFKIIMTLPILYRKALLKEPANKEALIKLAWWHIGGADETSSNFCAFIETVEEYIEDLRDTDKFMSHIWYSIYYMKKYNTKKGSEYFTKAQKLFPSHFWLAALYENYINGQPSL